MLRKLGIFEKAMLIANKHAPFNIVSVLRMENAPSPDVVREALKILQKRQPLMRVCIVDDVKHPFFENLSSMDFPFTTIERTHEDIWQEIAEKEMSYRYDHTTGPLFRATYIYQNGYGDLVLNVHHAIMDAVSGMNLLDEFMLLCAGDVADLPALELAPALETLFPPPYQGLPQALRSGGYALLQMGDMVRYLWRTRNTRTPPIRFGGHGHIATLILPEELVNSLSRLGRKKGITLNSLLNAALVLAINRYLYYGKHIITRTFSFVNMRPYTRPPMSQKPMANYISMMGFTIEVAGNQDFWELAKNIHRKIYHSLKRGDKFSASLMSESLLKMLTKMKVMRFGATALNYSGNIPLKRLYGEIKLAGLHGFVSGYDIGPEMASQARLFNDQVWWDFIYLDTDMDAELMGKIIGEINNILESASQNPA